MINIRKRVRRLDLLDYAMIKSVWVLVGIITATYISPLRGFVEQNIWVVLFLIIVVAVRPLVRFWK